MKKFITVLLIVLISLYCKNISALIIDNLESKDILVTVGEIKSLYNVQISWDKMQFVYNNIDSLEWESSTHEYKLTNSQYWSSNNNLITVNNKSGFSITADFNYNYLKEYKSIRGLFTNDQLIINHGMVGTSRLNLSGALDEANNVFTKIGTITITIS